MADSASACSRIRFLTCRATCNIHSPGHAPQPLTWVFGMPGRMLPPPGKAVEEGRDRTCLCAVEFLGSSIPSPFSPFRPIVPNTPLIPSPGRSLAQHCPRSGSKWPGERKTPLPPPNPGIFPPELITINPSQYIYSVLYIYRPPYIYYWREREREKEGEIFGGKNNGGRGVKRFTRPLRANGVTMLRQKRPMTGGRVKWGEDEGGMG